MPKRLFLLACLQTFALFQPLAMAKEARELSCRVVGVSDGDTLTCLTSGKNQLKVRLQYIDAPESSQAFGNRAKQALSALVYKKEVRLHISSNDMYGRALAVVFDRTKNINLALVQQGMAWAYRQTLPEYTQAQMQAQSARLGLWADSHPINPADYRKMQKGQVSQAPSSSNLPTAMTETTVSCNQKLSCNDIAKQASNDKQAFALAQRYFKQCRWRELDGNNDGIPCNKLYRKAQYER